MPANLYSQLWKWQQNFDCSQTTIVFYQKQRKAGRESETGASGNATHVLLTWPTLRQLCRLRFWPGLGKPFWLPQVRAMPGPPAPCFCICHLLSSADFLLSALLPVAPAVRTLGSCAARFIVAHTSIRGQEKQAAPGAACCKTKTKEKAVALARSRQASSLPAL